jgi:hypothetical protein
MFKLTSLPNTLLCMSTREYWTIQTEYIPTYETIYNMDNPSSTPENFAIES